MSIENLLTRKEIAEKLKVDIRHFRERIEKRPDFPAPKVRKTQKLVRWDERDVSRWLDKAA